MKYGDLVTRISDRILSADPSILADGGISQRQLDTVVMSTIDALGLQVTAASDVITVAPAPAYDSTESNANRRFRGKRR